MEQHNTGELFTELSFDHTAKQHLKATAKWAMTIVVVAVIGYLVAIFDLFTKKEIIVRQSEGFDIRGLMTNETGSSALISIGVGLLINFFLFRFASLTTSAVDGLNQHKLVSGFNSLKIYFVILSVIMIILFVIILLAVVFGATRTVV